MSGDSNSIIKPMKCTVASDSGSMSAVRLAGRGGQGIVTAGELMALAAYYEKKHAQAIPHFGAERRGGPAVCSLRISDRPILLKCNILDADAICTFDPTIWHFKNMFFGLKEHGILLFNTSKPAEEIHRELAENKYGYPVPAKEYEIYTVDATGMALEVLGRPIVNTAMMGAFVKATGVIQLDSIKSVIMDKIPREPDKNCDLAQRAFDEVEKFNPDDGA
jgi:2-oxoacid:acceptor oxidoreductase gamma subunit (pyruvate/2-ketoisovalerate family)